MAAKLECEICGGKLIGKPGGVFECENCGTEYSTEWAKTKIQEITGTVKVEGTVEVTGKVQIDNPVKIEGIVGANSFVQQGTLLLEDEEWEDAERCFNKAISMNPTNGEAYLGVLMAEFQERNKKELADRIIREDTVEDILESKNFSRARKNASGELKEWFVKLDNKQEEKRECEIKCQILLEEHLRNAADNYPEIKARFARYASYITAYNDITIVLKEDGTVVALGKQDGGQPFDVSGWADIVSITAGGDYHDEFIVGLKKDGTVVSTKNADTSKWNNITAIAAGNNHIVGLKTDGTVVAVGDSGFWEEDEDPYNLYNKGQCNVSEWKEIKEIAAYGDYTVGLKKDGTVVATGDNIFGQCDVSIWDNITAISAGSLHTVGLKSNGTVVAIGAWGDGANNVSEWSNIAAIKIGWCRTIGIRADGTVVSVGENGSGQCDVSPFLQISPVLAEDGKMVGLKLDGSIEEINKIEDHYSWVDIVDIAAGEQHTVGLRTDGTVESVGKNDKRQRHVYLWKDILAIAAGTNHTIGLRADGTLVATGDNTDGQCDVSGIKVFRSAAEKEADYSAACELQKTGTEESLNKAISGFKSLNDYKDSLNRIQECYTEYERKKAARECEEKLAAEQKRAHEREEKRAILFSEKNKLYQELANLKGLFTGKRRKEIEARLAEIEAELGKL